MYGIFVISLIKIIKVAIDDESNPNTRTVDTEETYADVNVVKVIGQSSLLNSGHTADDTTAERIGSDDVVINDAWVDKIHTNIYP